MRAHGSPHLRATTFFWGIVARSVLFGLLCSVAVSRLRHKRQRSRQRKPTLPRKLHSPNWRWPKGAWHQSLLQLPHPKPRWKPLLCWAYPVLGAPSLGRTARHPRRSAGPVRPDVAGVPARTEFFDRGSPFTHRGAMKRIKFPVTSGVIPCLLADNSLFHFKLARRCLCGLAPLNVADSGAGAPDLAHKIDKFPVLFPVSREFPQRRVRC